MQEFCHEQWRPVVGFDPCYEVSNKGRVRSAERAVKHPRAASGSCIRPAKIRTLTLNRRTGYLQVSLQLNSKKYTRTAHMLVAQAFLPPCPGPVGIHAGCWTVDHIDNDKTNNAASNLQWLPCDVNFRKDNLGERHSQSKLTESAVRAIREDTRTQKEIAADHGISQAHVSDIKRRKFWAHCA